jgi:hypothetical protein
MVGVSMKRLRDWLWSMYGVRAAARSMRAFWGSSQAVRYRRRSSSGRSVMPCTEPLERLMASRTAGVHSPSRFRSATR